MSEMVERASRAHSPDLWRRIDHLVHIDESADDLRADAMQKMRAAIEAMREPTGAMKSAGADEPVTHGWAKRDGVSLELVDEDSAGGMWGAMVGAALAEPTHGLVKMTPEEEFEALATKMAGAFVDTYAAMMGRAPKAIVLMAMIGALAACAAEAGAAREKMIAALNSAIDDIEAGAS